MASTVMDYCKNKNPPHICEAGFLWIMLNEFVVKTNR